jgi:hypothetical protein
LPLRCLLCFGGLWESVAVLGKGFVKAEDVRCLVVTCSPKTGSGAISMN